MVLTIFVFTLVHDAYGQAMSSTNYKLESESLNFGGARSNSGAYTMEDTFGEIATGISSSTNYTMKAGYQQMQEFTITVVPPTNVVMSPVIGGVSGGTSNGSTTFMVTTDNPAGYTATIVAERSPSLQSPLDSFDDYAPAGASPDFTFVNADTESHFAFSPEGNDIDTRYRDSGGNCGTGTNDTSDACWDGLSTSPRTIVNRTIANQPSGTETKIKFRAASGSRHIQIDGEYTSTTTLTILPL